MFQGLDAYKGPYIKYVREEGGEVGGQRIFVGGGGSWNILGIYWWAMKFFSKFFMGHKIFLCSILVILFFKLRGSEHKISKLVIKEI